MSDVSHGVNASKTSNGAITPVSVDTGVHFVVGTAPAQMVNGKENGDKLQRRSAGVGIFRRLEEIQSL